MASKDKKNTATYTLIQILCIVVMFMVVGYAALLKMGEDFWPLFQWWTATVILGIAFYPFSAMIFRHFDDRGYLFSKAIGLIVTAWLMWLLASLHILPFSTRNCYLCLGIGAFFNYFGMLIYYIGKRKRTAAKAHRAENAARKAEKKAAAANALRAEAEKVRAEAEGVKAKAEASKAEAEAANAGAATAKERKKAAQAQAEATKAAAEAAKAEARAVKAEAEAVKAEAEARASEAEAKAMKAEAEAAEAEEIAKVKDETETAETEEIAGEEDKTEAAGAETEIKSRRMSARTETRAERARFAEKEENWHTVLEMQELAEEKPFIIEDVPVKVLNVKPARVKEVRFRTGMPSSNMRREKKEAVQPMIEGGVLQSGALPKEGAMRSETIGEKGPVTGRAAVRPHWERILCLELVFFILFVAFMYMKGFNPKAYGTEKMMDYGFMTSMFKTEYFPVEDFWFAGESLNYYYFGQYAMTFLTKLSFTTVSYGYNLALGMGFAFCASLVYSLVCQIMKTLIAQRKKRISDAVAHIAGALGAIAVTIAGNGHYIIFHKLVPMLWDILQIPGEKPSYWFPNSTRYIGYIPDTHDKTIHEFPSYSFILGDLHAHVVNITFVLTLTAVLFSLLMSRREAMCSAVVKRRNGEKTEVSIVRETFRLPVMVVGYLIGIFMMSNYWDFPIYFVVAGAVILASNALICGFDKRTWLLTALHAIVVLAVAFLTALPFNMHFVAMANGILLAKTHTPLYQLIILWGLQFAIVIGFVTALIWKEMQRNKKMTSEKKEAADEKEEDGNSNAPLKQGRFVRFLENLEISDLFILILGLCAIGLVLTPEVIYMSDIYAGDYKRSNTMFKLVYQAYILFGISIGYILTRFLLLRETRRQLKWGVVSFALLLWTCGYFGTSVRAWFGDLSNEEGYKGMRADRYIFEEQPTDAAAIAWLNDNVQGRPVILEANGESYTISNRVSVLTGLPTVLGWRVHEWLWHNSPEPVSARAGDVDTIYVSQDQGLVRALLDKYRVTYLFIGTCEYDKYLPAGMNTEMLRQMGEVVYEGYPDMQGRVVMIVKVR